MRRSIFIFFVSILIAGCSSKVTTTGTSGTGKYAEDLSVWRPEAVKPVDSAATNPFPPRTRTDQYVEPSYAVTGQLDAVLDSIYEENLSKRFVDGYTIQIYSGIKREDALNNRKKMTQSLPKLESDIQYMQPNFRVRTGKYFTRLEAQKDYLVVKRYFPNAIVIPDKIPIN
jgi:hypothetical protein